MNSGAENYAKYLDGDPQGLAGIIQEFKNPLMMYLLSFVGDIYTAEDLAEDTFVKLAVSKPKYREEKASFKTWLYTIGRNVALDHLRKHKREALEPIDDYQELADRRSVEEDCIREEEKRLLHTALGNLLPEYREALFLFYFEGLDNAGIGRTMKKSKRQVENLLYRGKQALKKEMIRMGYQYEGL